MLPNIRSYNKNQKKKKKEKDKYRNQTWLSQGYEKYIGFW